MGNASGRAFYYPVEGALFWLEMANGHNTSHPEPRVQKFGDLVSSSLASLHMARFYKAVSKQLESLDRFYMMVEVETKTRPTHLDS